jgi:hypothetical protein
MVGNRVSRSQRSGASGCIEIPETSLHVANFTCQSIFLSHICDQQYEKNTRNYSVRKRHEKDVVQLAQFAKALAQTTRVLILKHLEK